MKKIIAFILVGFTLTGFAQFKDDGQPKPNIKDGIINTNPYSGGFLSGLFSPENFQMRHSVGLSYSAMGNHGVSLGVYTNSMFFKFADNLNFQVDASLVNSPYNTFGKEFTNDINGIYISRAALNYRPSEDLFISIQYNNLPNSYFYNPYNRFNSGYGIINGFSNGDWYFGR